MSGSHTEVFFLITAVSTVVLLITQHSSIDTVAVVTAEPRWHLTGDVHWLNTSKCDLSPMSISMCVCVTFI